MTIIRYSILGISLLLSERSVLILILSSCLNTLDKVANSSALTANPTARVPN